MRKQPRATLVARWIIGTAFVLLTVLFVTLKLYEQKPGVSGFAAMKGGKQVRVYEQHRWLAMLPAGKAKRPSVIFYPGAFAVPGCYAELGHRLAAAGHRVYIVKMPLNLAMFGKNRALDVMTAHPGESFAIGGHSLGGAFAARFASENPEKVKGVYFLGSYADKNGDLRKKKLPVLQITATKDHVISMKKWREHKRDLPDNTEYISIDGGNHAQFGSFKAKHSDGPASITELQQHKTVAAAMDDWLNHLR